MSVDSWWLAWHHILKLIFFFNFISGDVVCSKCQYIFSYGAVEKFFTNDKRSKDDLERDQNIFIKSKPNTEPLLSIVEVDENVVPINNLNTTELEEILSHLGINNITKEAFIGTDVLCHTKRRILYSPMQGTDSETIGYKILSKNGETAESTIPETNSFGVVKFSPIVKRGTKDQKTAILVLNILDALALRMENMTNGKFHIEYSRTNETLCFFYYFSYNNLSSTWVPNITPRMSSRTGTISKVDSMV